MQFVFVNAVTNCLIAIIGLPLGLFLAGYGVYLLIQGKGDYGVFMLVLSVAILLGWYTGPRKARLEMQAEERKRAKKRK